MSKIGKRIDALVSLELASRLKAAGYRKKGRSFWTVREDHTRVVNVQASRWNQGEEGTLAVNLGVFFPALAKLMDQPDVEGVPKEYQCTLRRRLGVLAHGGRDHWWSVGPETDLASTSREIAEAWTGFGVPWMESVATLEGARAELDRQGNPFLAGVVSLELGDRETARALVVESLRRFPRAAARTREWAARHGLL